ncbi:MAG: dienelactone hydrolase family protein [Phycisphaerales bacterium]|nr:dienelactone hydrolase family protein [Phycisphaerales bacterium]
MANGAQASRPAPAQPQLIRIPAGAVSLAGDLTMRATAMGVVSASGIVLFAQGAGSTRMSPHSCAIAASPQARGIATLLVDLLTPAEQLAEVREHSHRFDIPLMADRLVMAIDWIAAHQSMRGLAIGVMGAGTGAAAEVMAAARRTGSVHAVVCRGGEIDPEVPALGEVGCPMLLLAGERDSAIIEQNNDAAARMRPGLARVVASASGSAECTAGGGSGASAAGSTASGWRSR